LSVDGVWDRIHWDAVFCNEGFGFVVMEHDVATIYLTVTETNRSVIVFYQMIGFMYEEE
jgi:hypothetical protein